MTTRPHVVISRRLVGLRYSQNSVRHALYIQDAASFASRIWYVRLHNEPDAPLVFPMLPALATWPSANGVVPTALKSSPNPRRLARLARLKSPPSLLLLQQRPRIQLKPPVPKHRKPPKKRQQPLF